MANPKSTEKDQPDKNLAADERPVPSQAEGDRQTIEEDLKEKDKELSKGAKQGQ